MIRRAIAEFACMAGVASSCLMAGCGGPTTGAAPEAHDQDKTVGHMIHPAGGPNSPLAKASRKPVSPAK